MKINFCVLIFIIFFNCQFIFCGKNEYFMNIYSRLYVGILDKLIRKGIEEFLRQLLNKILKNGNKNGLRIFFNMYVVFQK